MAFLTDGQWGPEAFVNSAGGPIIGATLTVPDGYTATDDGQGNWTITGPPGEITVTLVREAVADFTVTGVRVEPDTAEIGDRLTQAEEDIPAVRVDRVHTASGGAVALPDATTFESAVVTLTSNATVTLPAPVQGRQFTVALTQDATGGRTVTFAGSVVWPAVALSVEVAAGTTTLCAFYSLDGVTWLGLPGQRGFV